MKAACIVLALLALALTVTGLVFAFLSASLVMGGSRAEGRVVRMVEVPGSGSSPTLEAPRIRYPASNGQTLASRGPAELHVSQPGEQVDLVYSPRQPRGAAVLGFRHFWLSTMILGAVGMLLVTLGRVLTRPSRGPRNQGRSPRKAATS